MSGPSADRGTAVAANGGVPSDSLSARRAPRDGAVEDGHDGGHEERHPEHSDQGLHGGPAYDAIPSATVTETLGKPPVRREVVIRVGKEPRRYSFQALGRGRFRSLQQRHPPKPEHLEQARAEAAADGIPNAEKLALRWNPETFPPALIAAASVEPKLTLDQAEELCDSWNEAEFEAVYLTALAAQNTRDNPLAP